MARVQSVFLLAVAAVCSLAQAIPEQPNHRLSLIVDWHKAIRGTTLGPDIQACVDRDENLQVINSATPRDTRNGFSGLWITLDRNGRILERTPEHALETLSSVSIWCAQNGQIVIGISSSQKVALRYSGSHQLLSRQVLPQSFRNVFTDNTDTLILAPFFGPAVLARIQQDASGALISHVVAATSDSRLTPPRGRFVVSDPRNGTFVSLESPPESIAVYSQSGTLLFKKFVHDPLCLRGGIVVGDPPAVCRDDIQGLFPLGHDLYIANVVHHSSYGETLEYQVLDMNFNVLGRTSATTGTIVATDDNGNVYGVSGDSGPGPQMQITRAHLVQ
jgi:hypothetical protein